jgi:hypothetical protein
VPDDLGPKALQTIDIAGHRMVVEAALYHGPQPLPDFGHWLVPAPPKLLPYGFEFCGESLRIVLRSTEKPPVFRFFAQMCVNPRKLNVSGLPWPRRFRSSAAKRPNSIRRVLSGCSSNVVHDLLQPARSRNRDGRCWGLPVLAHGVSMHAWGL